MVAVVLPTRCLMKEMKSYNHLFQFYGGGIKEFVAYHFQCSAAWNDDLERKNMAGELLHKAWIDYDEHLRINAGKATEFDTLYLFNRISHVNEYLSKQVQEIMGVIFGTMPYEVNQHWWEWADDDLIIGVDTWYA